MGGDGAVIGYLRLAPYVITVLALLAAGHAWRERGRTIDAQAETIREMTADAATLTTERGQCLASVEIQNTAIADLRAKGEAEQLRADAARAEADLIGAQTERRVQQAMAASVPAECPAAMEWLRAQGEAVAREWR